MMESFQKHGGPECLLTHGASAESVPHDLTARHKMALGEIQKVNINANDGRSTSFRPQGAKRVQSMPSRFDCYNVTGVENIMTNSTVPQSDTTMYHHTVLSMSDDVNSP